MRIQAIIFLLILFLLDLYVFQAFKQLFDSSNVQLKTIAQIIYWTLSAVCLGYIFLSIIGVTNHWNPSVNILVRALVFIVLFSKLPALIILMVDDLRRVLIWIFSLFGDGPKIPGRNAFVSKIAFALGALPFTSLIYGLIRNPYRYKLYHERIPIKNLPKGLEGLRIIQISDIHSGSFTFKEPIKNAIEIINKQAADIVVFTGDMVNSVAAEMDEYVDIFSKIKSKHGVFSVKGNHDYGDYHRWTSAEEKAKNDELFLSIQKKMGWDLLLNENRTIEINDEKLAIIGVENISGKIHFSKHGDLAKAYSGCEDCKFKLLLSHDPSHWEMETINKFKDIDLTLSGHTHGMQFGIEIPGWLKWSPIQYVYKQWAGLYKKGDQYLYVNRGLGFLGYPGRVGILPEITLLELEIA